MNFTQIPNILLDDAKLNPYQFMIMAFIVRKTDGWCKTEDGISLSQFVEALSISKNKVISSLKELKEMGFIIIKPQYKENGSKSYNLYSVSPKLVEKVNTPSASQGQGVVHEKDKGSAPHALGVVHDMDIQKKANTKETNTKDIVVAEATDNTQETINEIINHLNQVTDSKYKTSSNKTKTLIKARLREGFTLEDFKHVHVVKFIQWGKDQKMMAYLRPETLYGTKFESYLNEKITDNAKMGAIAQVSGLSALEQLQQMGMA